MEEPQAASQIPKQGADLLSQVHKSRLPSAPPGFYKSLSLDFVIVVFSAAAGVVLQKFLAGQIAFLWVLIVSGIFAALSVLGSLLTKSLGHRVLVIVFGTLAFILPSMGAPFDLLAICFGAMFLLLFWGESLSKGDTENSVEIRFFRVIKHPLSKMLSALTLVGVILYLPIWSQTGSFISRASFDSIFNLTTGIVANLYPEYQFGSSLDTFTKSIAQGQLEKDAQFTLLPQAIKTKVLDDASRKLLDGFSKTTGLQLNPQDTFATVAYDFLTKSFLDLRLRFGATFVVLWAFAVFLTLRGVSALLGYLVALFAFLLYNLMISTGIIRVKTENKTHEVIEFL